MHSNKIPTTAKPRTLELTVLSAEDLRVNGKPATSNVFVVVRAESLTAHTTSCKGNHNNNGNGFVTWNEKFVVEVAAHARSIAFEVKCKTSSSGSVRDVGIARVALADFLGTVVPDHCLQFLCYRLRDWDGLKNGVINFSVRDLAAPPPLCKVVGVKTEGCASSSSSSDNAVVTGIPVWWKNNC
ncbi:hypothetical protein PIB30_038235 [Stylosanthes scabra]|uniref:C2 domain-containing protein n=1 Tax=Stylosanthes scabra TaxID=79078 RepID=A0ABU6UDQ6_9FABA|nr:hypothetical protein [Stylosanthes scabra]